MGGKIVDDRCAGIARPPDATNDRDAIRPGRPELRHVLGPDAADGHDRERMCRREARDQPHDLRPVTPSRLPVGPVANDEPIDAGVDRRSRILWRVNARAHRECRGTASRVCGGKRSRGELHASSRRRERHVDAVVHHEPGPGLALQRRHAAGELVHLPRAQPWCAQMEGEASPTRVHHTTGLLDEVGTANDVVARDDVQHRDARCLPCRRCRRTLLSFRAGHRPGSRGREPSRWRSAVACPLAADR